MYLNYLILPHAEQLIFPIQPTFDHDNDSGLGLYVLEDLVLQPFEPTVIPHGISVEVPYGHEGQIRPRSSSLLKHRVHVAFGTIDNGYRGEISSCVTYWPPVMRNSDGALIVDGAGQLIKAGTRLSQLVISPVYNTFSTRAVACLGATSRGAGAYGSTGV